MSVSSENKKLLNAPLLITGGDPAGIGPELLEKSASLLAQSRVFAKIFATGDPAHIDRLGQIVAAGPSTIEIVPVAAGEDYLRWAKENAAGSPATPGASSGMLAFLALKYACDFAQSHGTSGLLTAPLSKANVATALGSAFAGHTDYLAERFHRRLLMIMHAEEISVIPLTVHVPLLEVSHALRRALSDPETTDLLVSLNDSGLFPGAWALCGLNPHAGENGHLGAEELDFMNHRAESWRSAGLRIAGPLPGDSVFEPEVRRNYRLILSAFHDQGLGPFKALVGRRGINVTWGLPFFRASPDHGTAFDIAGRNIADPTSMLQALRFLLSAGGAESFSGGAHGS